MQTITIGGWQVNVQTGTLPSIYDAYCVRAGFVDEIDLANHDGTFSFIGLARAQSNAAWPELIVAQTYRDAHVFHPGFLIQSGTQRLFIGAGERLLCYDLENFQRLWEARTDCGFWGWYDLGAVVVMAAELEFSIYSAAGAQLWSTFVEPPWDFSVDGECVELDVMGDKRRLNLADGSRA